MRRIFLVFFLVLLVMTISVSTAGFILYAESGMVQFDRTKITDANLSISFYDNLGQSIKDANRFNCPYVRLGTLPDYVKESFIAVEDKDFYKHNGLSYKRMAKAVLTNIKAGKIKQGASTISQQLIKNTHLSSEKTLPRKVNEMVLTKKLEKQFSKDEILEKYLNIIYFGSGNYGIESASNYYFSKSAKELTVSESALLAGLIKSPATYSPTAHPEASINRRNFVLRQMYDEGIISFEELNNETIKPLKTKIANHKGRINSYTDACLEEAESIMKMSAKQLAVGQYKIFTYLDTDKQMAMENSILASKVDSDYLGISISKDAQVESYVGSSDYCLSIAKRQTGSVLKPVLVYAPALERNVITPHTKILDEEINIDGYSPKNINGKYLGYVSAKESLSKSLNIPAIKILGYVGIDNAKFQARRCGIEFDENDVGLSIALGGLTNGESIINLANAYLPFMNNGNYSKARFINYITDSNGKIVYRNKNETKRVMREDTAYLMTDMLKQCAKTGTAKLLGDSEYEVASKTGTVGLTSNKQNLDAWNISYTSNNLVCVWLGNLDNTPINDVGGGAPTKIAKMYFNDIYREYKPANFSLPSSVQVIPIDSIEYNEHHKVVSASEFTPTRFRIDCLFSKFNLPKEKSKNYVSLNAPNLEIEIENNNVILSFNAEDYITYKLYRVNNKQTELIKLFYGQNGKTDYKEKIAGNKTKYYLIASLKNYETDKEISSERSNIVEVKATDRWTSTSNNEKYRKNWYI